jgi:regulator of sigma D
METGKFKEYADIKTQIRFLEERESIIKEAIMAELQGAKMDKAETVWGKFTIGTKKNYTYTDKVKSLEDKVKIAKMEEVEKGVAEVQETKYLLFKGI